VVNGPAPLTAESAVPLSPQLSRAASGVHRR
jgi:hypothetical protein